jgi:spore coat polysaccharide biosynthesis protein SpsF
MTEKYKFTNDLCFIVQARLGSTRLPNKMIIPFFKQQTVLDIILEKLKLNFPHIQIILAAPISDENDVLEQTSKINGCDVYRGSEEKVLERFIDAAVHFKHKNIIRVCADNPFVDVQEISRLIDYVQKNDEVDYVSFIVNGIPSIKSHFGLWVEFVRLAALQKTANMTKEKVYFEHVTNFIYENPSFFSIHFLEVDSKLNECKDIRMTVDTKEDFEILAFIYESLNQKYNDAFGINEIINFFSENEWIKKNMIQQIEQNSK